MSVKRSNEPSPAGKPRRFRPSGFTLVSTAVSMMVAGIMLAGGWMSYVSMLRQWKIGNAEREMDQYAAAAMQEFTNDLSWSWAGVPISGGQYTRWKFMFDDQFNENGQFSSKPWLGRMRDAQNFVVFNYSPSLGILIGGQVPPWAGDRWHTQYQWSGSAPRRGQTKAFDRRDRMTVEGFTMDWNLFNRYHPNTIGESNGRKGVVRVYLTMQYSYHGTFPRSDVGLYGDLYVRERHYETQISLKNWDSDANSYKDSLLTHAG